MTGRKGANPRLPVLAFLIAAASLRAEISTDPKDANKVLDRALRDAEEAAVDSIASGSGAQGDRGAPVPDGARIEVRVVDTEGRPRDARISVTSAEPPSRWRAEAGTTAGRCAFAGLRRGRYYVYAEPPGAERPPRRLVELPADRGTFRVAFTIRPDATEPVPPGRAQSAITPASPNLGNGRALVAQGRVEDRGGRAVDATVRVLSGGHEVGHVFTTAGRFSLYDLARGTYTLTATSARRSGGRLTIRVAAGLLRPVIVCE